MWIQWGKDYYLGKDDEQAEVKIGRLPCTGKGWSNINTLTTDRLFNILSHQAILNNLLELAKHS
jgi:hypothetical protein